MKSKEQRSQIILFHALFCSRRVAFMLWCSNIIILTLDNKGTSDGIWCLCWFQTLKLEPVGLRNTWFAAVLFLPVSLSSQTEFLVSAVLCVLLVQYFGFPFKTFSNVSLSAFCRLPLFSYSPFKCHVTHAYIAVKLSAIQMNYHFSSVLRSCQDIFKCYVSWLCKLLKNIFHSTDVSPGTVKRRWERARSRDDEAIQSWIKVIKNDNIKCCSAALCCTDAHSIYKSASIYVMLIWHHFSLFLEHSSCYPAIVHVWETLRSITSSRTLT